MNEPFINFIKSHGIEPEGLHTFVAESTKESREIFEMVRLSLPRKEANKRELQILNGEIFLSVIRNACLLDQISDL